MNELALFAGAGGGLLASRLLGWRTICYVENDAYCVEVLKARMRDGYLDDAPIWDDMRTFDGRPWAGCVDIVSAGFPCQPFSAAGLRLAENDPRNGWPDTLRIIREVGSEWVLLENVSRLLSCAYIRRIFGDLAEGGYDARWDCIPACAVGAPHIRDRVWIVAHASGQPGGLRLQQRENGTEIGGSCEILADTNRNGLEAFQQQAGESNLIRSNEIIPDANGFQYENDSSSIERKISEKLFPNSTGERCNRWTGLPPAAEPRRGIWSQRISSWWTIEPGLGRVAHGVAHRVDRLRAIGNGQVPAVAQRAWEVLKK